MKVLKFGGTSVGTSAGIANIRNIVATEALRQPVVVVVSALNGVTDQLIDIAQKARRGDDDWKKEYEKLAERHRDIIDRHLPKDSTKEGLHRIINRLLDELFSICTGVELVHDLSNKTLNAIMCYGERMSAHIATALIGGAELMNAHAFMMTRRVNDKHILHTELTNQRIRETFGTLPPISVVPGFVSSDCETGEATTLGRGGSDYTAALLAAALDAEMLDIWTDVDGFMTADPKIINGAYTIEELSYTEAMELCNFGARVIYPPTIYPVCVKNIPIRVKNIFNPEAGGTIIKQQVNNNGKPIKGISSISGTTIITVAGLSMVGVRGVNRRIFTTLANSGISVFMVSQASSENSTSIGVKDEDAPAAVEALNREYTNEISTGAMFPMHAESGLATIAIVGENIKQTPGVAGKLFGTLGRSGISVIACAQGAPGNNISVVIEGSVLRKALNVLHDAFFLSEYKELNLFLCGVGTVGGMLIEQIKAQSEVLKKQSRLKLNVVGIATSRKAVFAREGIDLDNYRQLLNNSTESNPQTLLEKVVGMNIFNAVFVDCTASAEISVLYQTLLENNISVITANKIAASGAYEHYKLLKETALERGVKFRYETNVGAGLPIIGTMNDLKNSGDTILKIEAVLSGTLNYIFNELADGVPFSQTVKRAQEEGYSEPDPRIDLSGKDVVRKLVILAREAGYAIEQHDVTTDPLLPEALFEGSQETFWEQLPTLDAHYEEGRKRLQAEGKQYRYVATFEKNHAKVELKAVEKGHPFYNLKGSNNIVLLTTERYKEYPMLIQGYGAGASVTAAGVFANIMSVANI